MDHQLIEPHKHRQLFADDAALETGAGAQNHGWARTMHRPKKCGPVIRPDRARGQRSLQSRSAPQWNPDKGIWEWWYFGDHVYYATSTDGETWERPPLGRYEWNGSRDNNIADDPEAGERQRLTHVIRDAADPDPRRRYKALFTRRAVINASSRFLATSPDGFDWTLLDRPPIPSSDECHFTYDEFGAQYLAMVKHGTEWGRSVFLSTSKDFEQFTDPQLIFHSDEIDRENCRRRVRKVVENPAYITPPIVDEMDYIAEVYQMAVMPYEGCYFGFPGLFNPFGAIPPPEKNFTRINQVELAFSRDLYHWDRVANRAPFIGIEPWDGERYDTSQVLLTGRPAVRPDLGEIWIYYNALRLPGDRENYREYNRNRELFRLNVDPDLFEDRGALSLAKLRLDGFLSLDGGEAATITTKPFLLRGEEVYLNVDAKWGAVYAEIVDGETLKRFPGFTMIGQPVSGDHLRARIVWNGDRERVFERPVRLIFDLHQARLYSFWLEK